MSSQAWKYAVLLDDNKTAERLGKMLDYWSQGPKEAVALLLKNAQSNSPAGATGGSPTSGNKTSSSYNNQQQASSSSGFRPKIVDQYVIFATVDGSRFLVSHSIARMCDSLGEILDELDIGSETTPSSPTSARGGAGAGTNILADQSPAPTLSPTSASGNDGALMAQMVDSLIEHCAVLEVAIPAASVDSVLVYLSLAIEYGATSVLPYPLVGQLTAHVQPWETNFLEQYAPHIPSSSSSSSSLLSRSPPEKNAVGAAASAAAGSSAAAKNSGNTKDVADANNSVTPGGRVSPPSGASAMPPCPPLLGLLRAADYLGINTLRDLTCAALASKLLRTSDEGQLAAMLGVPRLPHESELEDVYSRFPFLSVTARAPQPTSTAPTSP